LTPTFNVAVIQQAPVFLNLHACLDEAEKWIKTAANQGADVIAFPETWLPGYPVWLDDAPKMGLWDYEPAKALFRLLCDNALEIPSEPFTRLRSIAKKTGTYVVMGAHERVGGTLYNTMVFCDGRSDSYMIHRKLVPTYTERLVWGQGDGSTLQAMPSDFGPIGGLVCWEHWMPLARATMHAQHEVLHIAQWPMVKPLHQICSQHYAFEGQCFVIAAGTVMSKGEMLAGFESLEQPDNPGRKLLDAMPGNSEDLIQKGGSAVIGPDTAYVAGPVYDAPALIQAMIDPSKIVEGHLALDTDGHYSRPDVFQLNVNDAQQRNVKFESKNGG
jgi:predicted amidohydrolase